MKRCLKFYAILLLLASCSHVGLDNRGPASVQDVNQAISLNVSDKDYQEIQRNFLASIDSPTVQAQTFLPGADFMDTHDNPDGLSEAELKAIYGYTLGDYISINKALRNPNPSQAVMDDVHLANQILVMRKGLQKIKNFSGTVYRGDDMPKDFLDQHVKGGIVHYKGFTSTSTKRDVADGFALGQLLIMKVKHGKSVRPYSHQPKEDEILIDHDTAFKVISRKPVPKEFDNPNPDIAQTVTKNIDVITLEEVGD